MNQQRPKSTVIRKTIIRKTIGANGLAALLFLGSFGVASTALAGPLDSALYGPGLSDGSGFGVDLSIGGWLGGSRSPQPAEPAAEPAPGEAKPAVPEQPATQPQVRLFGSPDRAFGVEILNQTGQQEQRVRLGIPLR